MSFATLTLPDNLRRDSIVDVRYHTEGYLQALDRETLWYDALWTGGRVCLVGPRLNNLLAPFRAARFALDGQPVRLARLRRYKRHYVAELRAARAPQRVSVQIGGWRGESAVNATEPAGFARLNTLFMLQKDNDLHWIVDHARFHQKVHGLQAVFFLDNGSSRYGLDEIEAALAPLGLAQVTVLDAPWKYGPRGEKPHRNSEKYMQTALENVARLRFLPAARAVLNVDIDELVASLDGTNVFDAAVRSRLGFVQIGAHWRLPAPGTDGPYTHADHTHMHNPPKRTAPKWCLAPGGALGGFSWDVHGLERLPFLHGRTHKGLELLHCRAVSTGWKGAYRLNAPDGTRPDPVAIAALRAFDPLPQRP
ncbi:MAG: hypothetical protein KDK26_01145 [Roseivivax sp.]|nr:hypothetical protein [Roseivivax sp.]